MAKIRLDLSQFKASGVYTLEFDQTESIVLNTQTTRLVVGFSRKGPINAPVFCQDIKTAKRIFGEIDKTLEARGSFFHRSLFTCLETGPCFAIALMPLNNDIESANPDYDSFKSFSLSATEANGTTVNKLYSSYFNKERFFFPDTAYLLANKEQSANAGKLLSVVNLGQIPFSIIVRKTGDLTGFNLTAREWFGAGNVPDYIKEFDYISEYFVQVDIVQGDWTNNAQLSIDPVFAQYFDSKGLKKDKIQAFLNSPDVVTIGSFQGSLIPDLVDDNGVNYSIDTIINGNFATTGLFVALDRNALNNYDPTATEAMGRLDVIGHTMINNAAVDTVDFLSYNFAAKETFDFQAKPDFTVISGSFNSGSFTNWTYGYTGPSTNQGAHFESFYSTTNTGKFNNLLVLDKSLISNAEISYFTSLKAGSSLLLDQTGTKTATVDTITETADFIKISISHPDKASEGSLTAPIFAKNNGEIHIAGTGSNIAAGDFVYAEKAGVRFYFRANDIGQTGSNTILTIDTVNFNGAANLAEIDTTYTIHYGSALDVIGATGGYKLVVAPDKVQYLSDVTNSYIAYEGSDLYKKFNTGVLANGDLVYTNSQNPHYLTATYSRDPQNVKYIELFAWTTADYLVPFDGDWDISDIRESNGSTLANALKIYSIVGDYETSIELNATSNSTRTKVYISTEDGTKAEVGQYLVADPENSGDSSKFVLTRIIAKRKVTNGYELTTNQRIHIQDGFITRFKKIQEAATNVQFTYLSGFKLGTYHLPGSKTQLAKILGLLDPAVSNLSVALADRNMITYRYIVDTFNGGLDAQSYPKNLLSKLAMNRQKCLAIINAPAIQEFIDSTDPRFTEVPTLVDPKPVLSTYYISQGGNLSLGPSYTYSLPDEDNGAKFAGFFAPWLVIKENNKNISIPPAADVSNNFIRKFLNGQPYSIAAGPRRGILSNPRLVSLEYDFTDTDRGYLEPFGWNPIVFRNNTGFQIYGNQTAYQKTNTAFNSLHVRDLLITIEESVEDILGNYVFEFNDSTTRLEIKTIVDKFLANVKTAGGIYDYATVMNGRNNTGEVIDQNFAIIDIGVEPVKGAQKFINRVTVLKTGQISSGGFTVA